MNLPDFEHNLKDKWWRLNNLYRVMDPAGRTVVFRPTPLQQRFYEEVWFMNLVLKSRQVGMTTFIALYILDQCVFQSGVRAGIVAHTREDAGIILRDKVRFAFEHLPPEILSVRSLVTDSSMELAFSNNSSIRAGTSMRSSTLQYLHVSEFGRICARSPEKAREIVTGSLNAVPEGQHVFVESTAEGRGGYFHQFCEKARKRALSGERETSSMFRFHFFPWHEHVPAEKEEVLPERRMTDGDLVYFRALENGLGREIPEGARAWYLGKKALLGDDVYREYPSTSEEAFRSSVRGAYYAAALEELRLAGRIRPLEVDPALAVDTWWDLGVNDSTAIWFTQSAGREVRVVDYYENSGEGLAHYAGILDAKGYRYGTHTAPHDIRVRELGTGRTRLERARELGIDFQVAPRTGLEDGIEMVRKLLPRCLFSETACGRGVEALESYAKQWDPSLAAFSARPRHDWSSHAADAFRTLAVAHPGRTAPRRPPRRGASMARVPGDGVAGY